MRQVDPRRYVIQTPVGAVGLLYEASPFCLIGVILPNERKKSATHTQAPDIPDSRHPIFQMEAILKTYFNRQPIEPPWDVMRLDGFTFLQKAVLRQTARIPFGSLRTYQDIARAIGRPRAYRFVGTTLSKNPFPIFIPCHRVIRKDLGMGGFGGGIELKKKLIAHESCPPSNKNIYDISTLPEP